MRIERISDRQIRCTLNEKDLQEREIGISELAYGTSKAKALFRDMMQLASYELGFQTDDDVPVVIEAIPLLPESLIIIITKTEDPDELDTRFSTFTEDSEWDAVQSDDEYYLDEVDEYDWDDEESYLEDENPPVGDFVNMYRNSVPTLENTLEPPKRTDPDFISLPEALGMEHKPKQKEPTTDIVLIFRFDSLEHVIHAAIQISPLYHGKNTLYKNEADGKFYLLVHHGDMTNKSMSQVCNIIYEYGTMIHTTAASQYYFEEHFQPILADDAIHKLANI